jgi:hypothetical protein
MMTITHVCSQTMHYYTWCVHCKYELLFAWTSASVRTVKQLYIATAMSVITNTFICLVALLTIETPLLCILAQLLQ